MKIGNRFSLSVYGHVSPPSNFKRLLGVLKGSDIVSNYLIVSGDLKGAELIDIQSAWL